MIRMAGTLFLLLFVATPLLAQEPPRLGAPTLLKGPSYEKVIYPSPTLYDIDGDGARELIVGDLRGAITVAEPTDGIASFGAPRRLESANGKVLDLNNW